jgi:hypothetical protein
LPIAVRQIILTILLQFNRLACLRLTERCATILNAVKQEIEEADRISQKASSSSPTIGSPSKHVATLPRPGSSPKFAGGTQVLGSPNHEVALGHVAARLQAPLKRLEEYVLF